MWIYAFVSNLEILTFSKVTDQHLPGGLCIELWWGRGFAQVGDKAPRSVVQCCENTTLECFASVLVLLSETNCKIQKQRNLFLSIYPSIHLSTLVIFLWALHKDFHNDLHNYFTLSILLLLKTSFSVQSSDCY